MLIATDIADILLELPRIAEDVFVILGVFEESLGFLKFPRIFGQCAKSLLLLLWQIAMGTCRTRSTLCFWQWASEKRAALTTSVFFPPPKNSINCFWQWASCVKLCKSCIDVASLLHLGTSTLDYNAKFKESFPVDFKVFLLEIVVRRSSPSGVKYVQQCPLLSNFNYRHTIENWKCNGLLPGKSIKLGLPWSNPL